MLIPLTRWGLAAALWLLMAGAGLGAAAEDSFIQYRLPGDVLPESYNLSIVPYISGSSGSSFEGNVTIRVYVQNDTSNITLHAHESLTVTVLSVYKEDSDEALDTSTSRDNTTDFLVILFGQTLTAGSKYIVALNFSGDLSADEHYGFYLSSYTASDSTTTKYMATTHFEATHARKAFPCFDEPSYRATFNITIARKSAQLALSNMPLRSTSSADATIGNRVRDTFETTPSMPSYLVAFIVGELSSVSTSNENITLYVRDGAEDQVALAAELAPKMLKALESYTSVAYPLPKLNLVAVPTLPLPGMENWGLVTFREDALFYSNSSTTDHAFSVATLVAHELAHQWFGNLVTIDWWGSAWIKEGLAEYLQYVITDKATDSKYAAVSRIGCGELHNGLHDDAKEDAFPLSNYAVESPAEIAKQMSGLSYTKGAGFFHMLDALLTNSVFKLALNNYLTSYAYGVAAPINMSEALWQIATEYDAVPDYVDMGDLFSTWGDQPGFPLLSVERTYTSVPVLEITMARFLSHEATGNATMATDMTWNIPYGIYWQGDNSSEFQFQHVCPTYASSCNIYTKTHTSAEFYALNWRQPGFYRVNYGLENWVKLLANITDADTFGGVEVAMLLDDALVLSRALLLNTTFSLSLVQAALPSQRTVAPWSIVSRQLETMHALLRGEDELDQAFTVYVREYWLKDAYTDFGWSAGSDETHDYKVSRSIVVSLACSYGVASCREVALQTYEDNASSLSEIHADFLAPVLCEALTASQVSNVTYLQSVCFAEGDSSRRSACLYGLGCVPDTSAVDSLLKSALASLEPSDLELLVRSLIDHSDSGAQDVLDYMVDNYDSVVESIGAVRTSKILQIVAERICSDDQLSQLTSLAASVGDLDLNVTLLVAQANLEWLATAGPEILEWVTDVVNNVTQSTTSAATTATTKRVSTRATTAASSATTSRSSSTTTRSSSTTARTSSTTTRSTSTTTAAPVSAALSIGGDLLLPLLTASMLLLRTAQ